MDQLVEAQGEQLHTADRVPHQPEVVPPWRVGVERIFTGGCRRGEAGRSDQLDQFLHLAVIQCLHEPIQLSRVGELDEDRLQMGPVQVQAQPFQTEFLQAVQLMAIDILRKPERVGVHTEPRIHLDHRLGLGRLARMDGKKARGNRERPQMQGLCHDQAPDVPVRKAQLNPADGFYRRMASASIHGGLNPVESLSHCGSKYQLPENATSSLEAPWSEA